MTANRRGITVLALIAIAGALLAYGQERERVRERGGKSVRPAKQVGPEEKAIRAAPRRQPPKMPNAQVVVIPLKQLNPWEVHNVITSVSQARGDRLLCQVLGGNTLVVASDDEKILRRVTELVDTLDRTHDARVPTQHAACKAIVLEHAYAPMVAHNLKNLSLRGQPSTRIIGDEDANTVWITGSEQQVAWFADIAEQMDKKAAQAGVSAGREKRRLQFYALERANAAILVRTVSHVAESMELEVTIVPDAASGTLIAYATPTEHAQLETIIAKLDVRPKQPPQRPATPRRKDES